MGIARAAAGIGATMLAAVVLVGCTSAPPEPRPATDEEISALFDQQARDWWESFACDEPMPDYEVIEVLPPELAYERQLECLKEVEIPGASLTDDGGFIFPADGDFDDPAFLLVQERYWLCAQQYPADNMGDQVLSQDQLAWVYDFYVERYRPCLASLGFEFVDFPRRERFIGDTAGYLSWVPHDYSVAPIPTPQQWQMLAARCPLPSLLGGLGLPAYQSAP
jgi:hypothetical protein